MYMLSHTQGRAAQVWSRLLKIGAGAITFGAPQPVAADYTHAAGRGYERHLDATQVARSAQLFFEALRDDSNLEADWLWLASNVLRDHERRYCLKRALRINPHSEIARHELAKLAPLEDHILRLTGEQ